MRTNFLYRTLAAAAITTLITGCAAEHEKFVKKDVDGFSATRMSMLYQAADQQNKVGELSKCRDSLKAAIEAATKAYRLAWCDGPPFAYHWGLEKAKQHLKELGAPEPEMPPFDQSKFEPMPEVEIDPHDEFHAEAEAEQLDH